ncbi:MAG: glycosyltransferase [Acetobacteraceae bacterium]|nr:glycosyltransferase [Acetobacteraceae bacterium]
MEVVASDGIHRALPTTASRAAAGTCAIAVIAKAPRPGQVKTRLHGLLSPEEAAALGSAFLRDTLENVALASRTAPIAPVLAYAPAEAEAGLQPTTPAGVSLLLADGSTGAAADVEGFGRVLLGTTRALLAQGYAAACVLGADSPTLPTDQLVRAARLLVSGEAEAVLGPAEDGGYWLLGLTRPIANAFARIPWSTSRAAAETRERLREAGVRVTELGTWYDVDDVASLRRLAGERDGFPAPNTTAVMQVLALADRLKPQF